MQSTDTNSEELQRIPQYIQGPPQLPPLIKGQKVKSVSDILITLSADLDKIFRMNFLLINYVQCHSFNDTVKPPLVSSKICF